MSNSSTPTLEGPATGSVREPAEVSGTLPEKANRSAAPTQSENTAGEVSPVSWSPRDELDRSQWLEEGRKLGAIGRGSQWWIGDWVRYGTRKWGERYTEAAKLTGYDVASLRNMAWVASQYDDPSLRNDKLSWSHHVLLAPLDPEKKRAWIDKAVQEKLSVSDLRQELHPKETGVDSGAETATFKEGAKEQPATCPHCGHSFTIGPEDGSASDVND